MNLEENKQKYESFICSYIITNGRILSCGTTFTFAGKVFNFVREEVTRPFKIQCLMFLYVAYGQCKSLKCLLGKPNTHVNICLKHVNAIHAIQIECL